ncbi:AraC family transcriptional regulator [Pseudomonas costantinii]|uniref:AraC family transcriptional regulator n=1 Tax=Pseudomonas costantinii TaxID=168469 RepID=A0A1S2UGU8_9PSED|nr:helix-turn-helix transcriptional regulator [Pseudomonas costantinii]NVZ18552.1 helix-turn-helix transcriptional regulator [Pseudomonas costantinii]OIN45400.1 AraC family transcriptional regulator [Pseudomonas costantinii]SED39960.1 AraC-type DNA-binding protein [Pseudomonas costantinii]
MIPNVDSSDPEAVVTLREYPSGTVFERHTHPRGQFAYASTGALKMFTEIGNWVVPPQRAIWVPGGVPHEMHMRGDVVMLNTYLDQEAARRAGLQDRCQVFEVSPLLRHLLEAALAIEPSAASGVRQRCVLTLLIDEIGAMPELPLSAPLPAEPRLARACQRFLEAPTQKISLDEMADWSNMSRRTFTRHFHESTGMTFVSWRQQVCLLEATARLSHGATITDVAFELGFSSSSAFTSVFRRNLGESPARYLAKSKAASLF